MSKPTLEDIESLNDPMLNDNFDFTINNIPGSGSTRALRLQCRSSAKPGCSIQQFEVELFGHKTIHAARKTFSNSMSVTFIETYDGSITTSLEDWAEKCRGTNSQSGEFKADYTASGRFTIYDQTGAESLNYDIHYLFPTEVPDLEFDGSGGNGIEVSTTFSYDYYEKV